MDECDYESLPTNDIRVHLFAGAAAGVMEHCIMYPVDSVKTRLQSLKPNPNARYRNILHAFKTIAAREGLYTSFRGINAVAAGAGPAHALYFSCYESMKKLFGSTRTSGHNPVAHGVAGAFATLAHDGAMNPIEVIKQRMQMYGSPYKGVLNCAVTVWREEGVRAFYRSYTTQLSMNIPFQSIHFIVYEFFQEILNPSHTYKPETHVVSGGLAGAIAAAATTPLDVAKTLLNTQERGVVSSISADVKGPQKKYVQGMIQAVRTIYQMQGFRGYFKGLHARVIYQMPSCAICWSVYEFFKHFLALSQKSQENLSPPQDVNLKADSKLVIKSSG